VMEMERMGIPIRSSAASGVGSALMDDIATTYFFRHHSHRETIWSTPWHSENVTSTRPFPSETREGGIDLKAKQLMCAVGSMRDSSHGVV
jgi:hypothetical protein